MEVVDGFIIILRQFVVGDFREVFPTKQSALSQNGNDGVIEDEPSSQQKEENDVRDDIRCMDDSIHSVIF